MEERKIVLVGEGSYTQAAAKLAAAAEKKPEPEPAEVPSFTVIPLSLLCRRDLTAGAKVVLAAKIYTERSDVQITGDLVAVITQLTGLSPSKVKGHLTELTALGILQPTGQRKDVVGDAIAEMDEREKAG